MVRAHHIAIAVWVCATAAGADTRELFERARALQERNQNLSEAIRLYGEVVAQEKALRGLAARALYEQGILYQRLGRRTEARHAFQSVIRDFPDQPALTAMARNRLPAGAIPSGAANRALWTGDDVDELSAPSPDGRFLAFTDWTTGDLRIRDVALGESRQVTRHGAGFAEARGPAMWPVFSSDSRLIAYAWFNGPAQCELRVIAPDGTGERTVLRISGERPSIHVADWSPGGKYLLVFIDEHRERRRLAVVSVPDGGTRFLPVEGELVEGIALFSRDGGDVIYEAYQKGSERARDIFSVALDGSRRGAVVQHPADDHLIGWAPDGRLIFLSDRSGESDLWAVPFSAGAARGEPEVVYHHMRAGNSLGLTRRGTLFYVVPTTESEIFTAEIDADAGALLSAPKPLSQRFVGAKTAPVWAADGNSVIYKPTLGSMLIVVAADGREREIHPQLREIWRVVAAHPQGGSVFVQGASMDGQQGVYRVALDGGGIQFVGAIADRPAWSSDGAMFYYGGGNSLFAHDSVSGVVRTLFQHPVGNALKNPNTAVSPDGTSLAILLEGDPKGSDSLATLPATGGTPQILFSIRPPEHFGGNTLAWTRDGKYILASRNQPRGSELWRFPANGGPPDRMPLQVRGEMKALRLHPDGRHVVFLDTREGQEIWTLDNFLTPFRGGR